jgi:hypothetical protein
VLDLAEPRDKPPCHLYVDIFVVIVLCKFSSPATWLIRANPNQVLRINFQVFTGSPIHPPPL